MSCCVGIFPQFLEISHFQPRNSTGVCAKTRFHEVVDLRLTYALLSFWHPLCVLLQHALRTQIVIVNSQGSVGRGKLSRGSRATSSFNSHSQSVSDSSHRDSELSYGLQGKVNSPGAVMPFKSSLSRTRTRSDESRGSRESRERDDGAGRHAAHSRVHVTPPLQTPHEDEEGHLSEVDNE